MTMFNLRAHLNARGGRAPQAPRSPRSLKRGTPDTHDRDRVEIGRLKGELAAQGRKHAAELKAVTDERDELSNQRDEHQAEFPNGCMDLKAAQQGNTFCPGTGRADHSEHSIQCFSV